MVIRYGYRQHQHGPPRHLDQHGPPRHLGLSVMITLGALNDISGLRHGFFTREGGVSTGPYYASLNCALSSGDQPAAVLHNRARAAARFEMPVAALHTLRQVHSATVVEVEGRPQNAASTTITAPVWAVDQPPAADALVTRQSGVMLGILTADCVPVLFADPQARVIGAAHAGWKGALCGVIEATVQAMIRLGGDPARLVAAIGPCIAQRSYEVGPEFPIPFLQQDPESADLFAPSRRAGHFMFDLPAYVARRLERAGVAFIQRCPNDTAAEEARFFSYRRATLRGEPDYGRGLSAIALQD